MPITLSLLFFFGKSTLFLIKNIPGKHIRLYILLIVSVFLIYTYADKPNFNNNKCEKTALQKITNSKSEIVALDEDCSVVSWYKIEKPEDSDLNAQLLYKWKITDRIKLYYNSKTPGY